MRSLLFVAVLALVPPLGCRTPGEGDRRVNDQNIKAGAFVETTSTQPEVSQAGKDVKENSLALERNIIGKPESPQPPYSSKTSREARDQSDKEHAVSPFWATLGGIGTLALGWLLRGGALRLFTTLAPTAAAGPLGTVATVLIEGIARIRKKAQESPTKMISEADLLTTLEELQTAKGVQPLVDKLRAKIESKITSSL